jgi:polyisoprenoid-binding protein YceI
MKTFLMMAISLGVSVAAVAESKIEQSAKGNKPVMNPMLKVMTFKIDPAASKIAWVGKKIAGPHSGTVGVKEGQFEIKSKGVTKGEIVIDLNNIVCEDLKDPEYNAKLVGHLKGEDFFDVAKHPTATFKIDSFQEVMNFRPGEPNAVAKGKLTIRGVTKPYETKLFFNAKDDTVTFTGKMMIDRTQFGLKYNSKKFFDPKALGDKLIDDQFEVDLNLVAKK